MSIKLSQNQLSHIAKMNQGMDPLAMSNRRSTQVQRDRKAAQKRGYSKHKGRMDF